MYLKIKHPSIPTPILFPFGARGGGGGGGGKEEGVSQQMHQLIIVQYLRYLGLVIIY